MHTPAWAGTATRTQKDRRKPMRSRVIDIGHLPEDGRPLASSHKRVTLMSRAAPISGFAPRGCSAVDSAVHPVRLRNAGTRSQEAK